MDEKACQECGEIKPVEAFSKDRYRSDGLQARCKACNAAYRKAEKARDPEKVRRESRERFAKWYGSDSERARERSREQSARFRASMTEEQREAERERSRAYYLANQEELKARAIARHRAKLETAAEPTPLV